jgi:hypothetical protein
MSLWVREIGGVVPFKLVCRICAECCLTSLEDERS